MIAVDRGKLLRFTGPMGLAGRAITMVHTFTFEAAGDKTRLKLSLHVAGEVSEGLEKTLSDVWDHFLGEQFKPWVEGGRHRKKADS